MSRKTIIWIGVGIGSTVGGFLPMIWGGSLAGISSVFLTAAGGIAGIYFGNKLSEYF